VSESLRIVVLGAGGQLARHLVTQLSADDRWNVAALSINDVDIRDAKSTRTVIEHHSPHWVINAAAFTRVDDCETNSQEAFAANANGVANVATACQQVNARLVHISTDFVFDGNSPTPNREDDPPNPVSVYGRSKLAGEEHALTHPDNLVIRTAWLFGLGGNNFVETMLKLAATGRDIRVVNDQRGNPTYAADLSAAIVRLMIANARGIFHVTNSGAATWYDFACEVMRCANVDVSIRPIATKDYPTPATRPANSTLDCSKYERFTGHTMRHWPIALSEYIARRPTKLPS
jgi:dTDP-4-dehydrorhamnose reductase